MIMISSAIGVVIEVTHPVEFPKINLLFVQFWKLRKAVNLSFDRTMPFPYIKVLRESHCGLFVSILCCFTQWEDKSTYAESGTAKYDK